MLYYVLLNNRIQDGTSGDRSLLTILSKGGLVAGSSKEAAITRLHERKSKVHWIKSAVAMFAIVCSVTTSPALAGGRCTLNAKEVKTSAFAGNKFITANEDGIVHVWNTQRGSKCGTLLTSWNSNLAVLHTLVASTDGNLIAVTGIANKKGLKVNCVKVFTTRGKELVMLPGTNGFEAPVIAITPNNRKVVAYVGLNLIIWDAKTGKLETMPWHETEVIANLQISPDSSILAINGETMQLDYAALYSERQSIRRSSRK